MKILKVFPEGEQLCGRLTKVYQRFIPLHFSLVGLVFQLMNLMEGGKLVLHVIVMLTWRTLEEI